MKTTILFIDITITSQHNEDNIDDYDDIFHTPNGLLRFGGGHGEGMQIG